MADAKSKILIVEDDLDVAEMLNAYFRVQGYDVFTVNWGEDGVRAAQTVLPDLMILDIRLPDIDGFEVARRVRTDRRTHEIPIIFLTEKRERMDRLLGFEVGADDYITKPFDVQELRLRVRNALKRVSQGSLTNPVSGLPEGPLVDERLSEVIHKSGHGLLHIAISHLDSFREAYGFVASDDVLRAISLMVHNTMKETGSAEEANVMPSLEHLAYQPGLPPAASINRSPLDSGETWAGWPTRSARGGLGEIAPAALRSAQRLQSAKSCCRPSPFRGSSWAAAHGERPSMTM